MGLGDITDKDAQDEWDRAVVAFGSLAEAGIPYSVVIGNHDGVTNSTKDNAAFNSAISTDYYNSSLGGKYDKNMDNTWRKIEVNGTKYLIFTLGYGANDDILSWASEIIEENQDYNVIITLHVYMYRDGTTIDSNDKYPPSANGTDRYGKAYNDGDDIYEKLIKKHSNIVMVLSGHDPCPYIVHRTDDGTVQLLTDHQYVDRDLHSAGQPTTGMVTMFYISEDGKTVTVECYSTVYEMYYSAENQFTFTLNVVD